MSYDSFINAYFSNREISFIFWSILFVVCLYCKASKKNLDNFKKAFGRFKKSLFNPNNIKLYLGFGIAYLWISICIYMLDLRTFFNSKDNLKDLIIWCVASPIPLIFNKKSFKQILFSDGIKIMLIEFIISKYTFSLWLEIIVVPISSFVAIALYYSKVDSWKDDEKMNLLKKVFEKAAKILAIFIISCSIYMAVADSANFFTIATAKSFLLPFILTLLMLPILFGVKAYSKYEQRKI